MRNNIQKMKIDMANEVIDAGRFDMNTSMEERKQSLESLLQVSNCQLARHPCCLNLVGAWLCMVWLCITFFANEACLLHNQDWWPTTLGDGLCGKCLKELPFTAAAAV